MSTAISLRALTAFLLTISLLLISFQSHAQFKQCKLLVDSTITLINGHDNAKNIKPGDTICLKKGTKSYLLLSYLHGKKDKPIIIQNADGLVSIHGGTNYGVKFDSCSYIKFSGLGIKTVQYGIKINQFVGAGLSVDGLSTDIEIEGLDIGNTGLAGIFAKTDPNCLFTSTREKFTLRNLSIHDNYIHNTGMEGMYIGSSKYSGQTISCGGKDTTVLPHMLRGVKVYRNTVTEAGWDGIQVSSADSAVTINDNLIFSDSKLAITYQMSGILVGGGTHANVFNNIIKDGLGDGIDVTSMGIQNIFNNLIINPGKNYKPTQNVTPYLKHGIYIGPDYTSAANSYRIIFNTIISPKSYGVRFADNQSINNVIANNIIVNPGSYSTIGNQSYINLSSSSIDVIQFTNLNTVDINSVSFIDHIQGNYDLNPNSQAVNNGTRVEVFDVLYDLLNRTRPFAKTYDIGAYECHDSSLLDTPEYQYNIDLQLTISPNPSSGPFTITYNLTHSADVTILLIDIHGRVFIQEKPKFQESGKHQAIIHNQKIAPGFYSLIFRTGQTSVSRKVIILNN